MRGLARAVDPEVGDCEAWDDGFPSQPVAAWSSLAYVGVGVLVLALVVRRRLTPWMTPFAVVVAVEGVGSLAYHGSGGDLAQVLHDAPLVGLLGFVAGWQVARVLSDGSERSLGLVAVAGLVVGLVIGAVGARSGATAAIGVPFALLVVVAELVARRRRLAPIWGGGLVALTAVAGLVWWLGTSDSPVCAPGSVAQPHGAWHLVSALVLLAWVDAAASARDPVGAPRILRRATDALLAGLCQGLVFAFYRSSDVVGRERVPWGRPMLVVANHGNGFVDPVLVAAALRRFPRFMAKAALWKVLPARPFLTAAGVLPVYRRGDGDDTTSNTSVFEACHREHERGGMVAIFPEGTTGDRAALDRVRTGAARIALGSTVLAPETVVVPVGLAFESRVETRGRALVVIGEPIDPDRRRPVVAGEPDHDDVDRLTDRIRLALEGISPEFASVEEREVLRAASQAHLAVTEPWRASSFGAVEVLARRLAAASTDARAAVVDAYRIYAARLQLIGLRDRQLRRGDTSWRRLLLAAVAVGALGSVVVTAALVHLPALLVTWGATAAVRSTATKGTVRVLVGLATGFTTWVVFGAVVADGWAAVSAGLLIAAEGALALVLLSPLLRWVDDLWGRIRMRDRAGLLPPVLHARSELSERVSAALDAERPST